MILKMEINNVKSIKNLKFEFPLERGLYAITGENASGKSTLVACASTVFFQMPMTEYFGRPDEDAYIKFELEDTNRMWCFQNKIWKQKSSDERMKLNGFYEGSIIFGNRFKDMEFNIIKILDNIFVKDIREADDFIKRNLGIILHDNEGFYNELFVLKEKTARKYGLKHQVYFNKIKDNKYISQARMSTGENLLLSILHSLKLVYDKRIRSDGRPCIVFLDEIELALHASALRRLVNFLKEFSEKWNLAIFFSTHSLELIRDIKPSKIYYLTRYMDDSIQITNPCYPAFATRNLYSDDGYGNDLVILVEDDLAKSIVDRLLKEKNLINNIRVKILPTGGWTNTITMAWDIISSGLLLKNTRLAIILDRDVKSLIPRFISNNKKYNVLKIDYLPIYSLEKYLREKLIIKIDGRFYNKLDSYIFQKQPIKTIINKYQQEINVKEDNDGKSLYGMLENGLKSCKKDRDDLVELVVKYLFETEKEKIDGITRYLESIINE